MRNEKLFPIEREPMATTMVSRDVKRYERFRLFRVAGTTDMKCPTISFVFDLLGESIVFRGVCR